MPDYLGRQLGNYRLVRLIGQGGFASVYLGEHILLGTTAAIKVLQTQLADLRETKRFVEEARTIAPLNHPNIVRILDFGVEGTTPYLVMTYAPNGTLRHRHPRGSRLPAALVLTYIRQTAAALQYAHDRRVIHRDVKPENMLLSEDNEVLLGDFGIAFVAQNSAYHTTQDIVGTVYYMAPEQVEGHPQRASDEYSLAVVAYEWLAGEPPFAGSILEVLRKHAVMPPPLLRDKVPHLSQAVEQVVTIALSKHPEQRFSSIRAFAHAFEEACKDEPTITYFPALVPSGSSLDVATFEVSSQESSEFSTASEDPTRDTSFPSSPAPTVVVGKNPPVDIPPVASWPPQAPNPGTPDTGTSPAPGSPVTVMITPSVSGTPLTIVINPSAPGIPPNIGSAPPNAGGTIATPNGQVTIVINQSTPDVQTPAGTIPPVMSGGPTIIVTPPGPAPGIATPPSGFAPGTDTMVSDPAGRVGAFISYSHKDRTYLNELHAHLRYFERTREMVYWDDTRLTPGSNWRAQIKQAIDSSKVAVLLISADFLASEFIAENELPPLLTAAQQKGAIILSVILRPSLFKYTSLAQFQTVNAPTQPLMGMSKVRRDQVWTEVAECIRLQQWQPK